MNNSLLVERQRMASCEDERLLNSINELCRRVNARRELREEAIAQAVAAVAVAKAQYRKELP